MVNFKPFFFNGQIYAHQFLFSASCTYLLAPAPLKRKNEQQKKSDLCLLGVLGPSFHFIGVKGAFNIPNILFMTLVSKFGHHQLLCW